MVICKKIGGKSRHGDVTISFHFISHRKITEKSWRNHGHNIKLDEKSRSRHDIKFMVEEKPCITIKIFASIAENPFFGKKMVKKVITDVLSLNMSFGKTLKFGKFLVLGTP